MNEIQAIANFVSKKISKVRWRSTSKHVVQKPTIFASGSWDDNVRNNPVILKYADTMAPMAPILVVVGEAKAELAQALVPCETGAM